METPSEAQSVVSDLMSTCHCSRSDIGLMAKGSRGEASGGAGTTGERGDEMASGALKGAGTGAAVGGILGLVAGVASLAIPGFGPIIAAGPIASALAGAGIGAAAGGVIGALTHLGVPEDEAHYYAEGVRRGGTLITVRADSEESATCAAQVMRKHGAADIDERATQWKSEGWGGRIGSEDAVLPVTEEQLAVGKRQTSKGGVRIYTDVTETPVEETVELREEHAEIERRPVDRPVSASDEAFREQSIEMRETAEEPVVEKKARVTEEVVVGKKASTRTETVKDTVRKSDVKVEKTGSPGTERRRSQTPFAGVDRRSGALR
jgi:uncharacterized protein (TIGR02271 family)